MSADGSDVGSSEEPMPPFFTRLATTTRGGVTAVGTAAAGAFMVAKDGLESLRDGAHKTAIRMDKWAAAGVVGRTFRFKERSAKLTSELRAGLITFLMVSYILAVNPAILQTTGGTCDPTVVCTAEDYELLGPQCLTNTDDDRAQECMMQLTRSLITATAVSSLISTFFIGYFGNLPLALAPGIGITAYVSYQVVGQYGTGQISYQQAMTAVFIEGFIFIILSVTGVRGGIIKYMPKSIAMASSVGIGMLLAFTGLRNLGLIVFDSATLLTLGGCPPSTRNYLYAFDQQVTAQSLSNLTFSAFPAPASVYGCVTDSMRSPTMWLGVAGGFLMCILLYMGIKGSLILGILFVTIISWIPGHGASYLGASSPIPGGEQRLELFKELVAVPTLSATGLAWDWSAFSDGKLWLALFTFLYIDLLDCTGTLLSMARLLDFNMPGFLSESMEFPGQMWAFLSDGIGIISGSMMGTTSLTVYIESAAGIEDGGRTGLTAVVVSFFFLASLFFSPIIASIPPYATGPALVLVGTILLGHIAHIEWDDIGVAIPAFLTMVLMPFTYSVAYGVIAGLVSYVAIHAPFWAADFIRKRWRPGSGGPNSPRLTRAQRRDRRSKTGYHMRKTFGPQGDPPSRADSFVGGPWYDDSYHTQDSRRSALPISMLPGGGGGMGMAAGSMPNSIYPPGHSIAPSIVNMFFPDNSVRGGGTVGSMRGAITGGYGRSGSAGDTDLPSASNGLQNMYRKSYSLHSPRRATDPSARSPTPDLGSRTQNRSLTDVHSVSPTASSPMPGYISRASPHSFRPALIRQMSARGASLGGSPRKGLGPAHNKLKMQRSCSFSHGINDLGQGSDLHLKQQSTSDHGGNLFKLFPDAPNLEGAHSAGFAGMASASFKLFGDVEPLALGLSGEVELADGDAQAEQPFRLFGDIEPLELHKGKQREGVGGNSRAAPTFRVSSHLNDNDRTGTADLTFGGTSPLEEPLPAGQRAAPPAEDWLKGTLRGSSAYSEMILEAMQAQASQEMSPAAGQAGLRVPSSFQAAVAGEAAAAAMAAAAAGGSAASLQQCGSSSEKAQRAAAPAPAGTSNGQMAGEGGGTGGGEEDEVVYRKLMSSKSLQGGSAPRSDASADGGRTTYSSTSASSSVHGGTPAHGFLKPSSLVAAAAQLASVYKQDGQRHPSSEGSGRSLGANPVGASPEDHPSFLGAAASAPTSEPTAEPLLQQRASPFEGQRVASAPEGGLLDGASTERDYWNPRGPASSKASHWMSGAAPDEEHLE